MNRAIFLGFEPREAAGFSVAKRSIERHLTRPIPIYGIVLGELMASGHYTRPTKIIEDETGQRFLVDELSVRPDYNGRISTEHAIARFLVPHLWPSGWALFMDCDILVRQNLVRLFDQLDASKALYCVQHAHEPIETAKMDGQLQTRYARKNWSSVMAFNIDHPATRRLTIEAINTMPGRELHRLCWLYDHELGELDQKWNWLAGHSDPAIDPAVVHFTNGLPDMRGYETSPFADEWRAELTAWASNNLFMVHA